MTSATTHCPERITPATLAAWRDGALSPAEATRLAAHVPDCSACRAELAAYEALDAALRRYHAPEPDARLWRGARDRMNGGLRPRPRHRGTPARRLVGGLGALAAVVLLALGFAQLLRAHVMPTVSTSATRTTSSTPTPLPTAVPASPATNGPRLSWQQAQLPIAPLAAQDILTFGVAPTQGQSAYACHAVRDNNGTVLTFFHTSDRALHWTSLAQLTEPDIDVSDCLVQVDALDASRVLIQVRGQNMPNLNELTWYELSEDGGTTWTRLNESATIEDLATLNGKTFALRLVATRHATGQTDISERLYASTDHLRTWQPVDRSLFGPNQIIAHFWLSPGGELVAEVTTGGSATPGIISTSVRVALWRSSDGGAHWTSFQAPTPSIDWPLTYFIVQQPTGIGQPWHFCMPYKHGSSALSLACTFDSGRTWSTRPMLCLATPCAPAFPFSGKYVLASDGAVLQMQTAPDSDSQRGLYRLPRDSATWQYLGPTPGGAFFFVPASHGGVLWTFADGAYLGGLSGSIGGHHALPGVFATATYP